MILTKVYVENVPFDWEFLEKELNNYDYFNPKDADQWENFVNDFSATFSEEELLSVKDKIIEFEESLLYDLKEYDLDYYLSTALRNLFDENEYITKDDIIKYINIYMSK